MYFIERSREIMLLLKSSDRCSNSKWKNKKMRKSTGQHQNSYLSFCKVSKLLGELGMTWNYTYKNFLKIG